MPPEERSHGPLPSLSLLQSRLRRSFKGSFGVSLVGYESIENASSRFGSRMEKPTVCYLASSVYRDLSHLSKSAGSQVGTLGKSGDVDSSTFSLKSIGIGRGRPLGAEIARGAGPGFVKTEDELEFTAHLPLEGQNIRGEWLSS